MRFMSTRHTLAALAAAGATTGAAMIASAQTGQANLPTTTLSAGIHLITAEVAADDAARMKGLMFRSHLAPNHGMFFIFDEHAGHCMWMRNTLMPLSVAFIDDDGAIVNIEDMDPKSDDSHCARRPVRYALEMTRGWFAQHGLQPGSRLTGLPGH